MIALKKMKMGLTCEEGFFLSAYLELDCFLLYLPSYHLAQLTGGSGCLLGHQERRSGVSVVEFF